MDGAHCKRNILKTTFDSLSDDVVFDILVRLPIQDIYNAARLVCRKWHQMINSPNFIYPHLHHSTCGLLVHSLFDQKRPLTLVAMRDGRIEISELSHEDVEFVLSSCDGLVLHPCRYSRDVYIRNPVTKRRFHLPRTDFHSLCRSNAIAYASTSMAYKVVYLFDDGNPKSTGCAMLTVGVDKSWRRIAISEKANGLGWGKSLTIEGFILWTRMSYVLMLNVETEIFTKIDVPQFHGERLEYYYLAGGRRYLSLLVGCTEFSWEVWEMKPETGEWTKLPNINFEGRKCMFEQLCLERYNSLNFCLTPVGWLKYQEVLLFNVCVRFSLLAPSEKGLCIAYNIRTQEIESFELDKDVVKWSKFFAHRNSLVALNGCYV